MKYFIKTVMIILLISVFNFGGFKASAGTAAGSVKETDAVLVNLSKDILKTIKARDYKALAVYIHPQLGVRFSPYSFIDTENDRKLSAKQLMNTKQLKKKYTWGEYDGSGEPIKMTVPEYFGRFIYDADFLTKGKVSVNEAVQRGNTANNIKEAYPGCVFTEFMIPGLDPRYEGIDWRALSLVYKKENDKFYLIGIIHSEHTI